MGDYLLCKRPLAKAPFYIESVHLNLYSVEELCYFLSENLALADEAARDPVLSLWLSRECGFEEKIREYEGLAADDRTGSRRLYWIFVKSHYFSEAQLKKLKLQLEELDAMPVPVREKARGDVLIRNRKYMRCISCYERVLDSKEAAGTDGEFRANVWYHMGCAYARLFQGGRAEECFRKAFETAPSGKYRDALLMAAYFEGGSSRMKAEGRTLKLSSEEMEKLQEGISSVSGGPLPEDPEKTLREWIREYHRGVDQ